MSIKEMEIVVKTFPSRIGQGYLLSSLLFNILLEILAKAIGQEEEIKVLISKTISTH